MPIQLKIDHSEIAKLEKNFGKKSVQVKTALANILKFAAFTVEAGVKTDPQFKHPTGRLLNSITREFGETYAYVGPQVYYAKYVNFGTRYITPNPFMERGIAMAEPKIAEKLKSEVEQALNT